MRKTKILLKKIIISIIILMILLATAFQGSSMAYTQEEVMGAVAGFAAHVVDEYKNGNIHVTYSQPKRESNPYWDSSYTWSSNPIYFDCTSFACGTFHYVAGIIDYPHCSGELVPDVPSDMATYFDKITNWNYTEAELQVGDLLSWNTGDKGHGFIYVGGDKGFANDGYYYTNAQDYINRKKNSNLVIYRLNAAGAAAVTNLNTSFSIASVNQAGGLNNKQVDYSDFFFNGIPDGKYSLATNSLWDIIVEALKGMLDYFVGYLTYIIRLIIVGVTSLFDKLLNNAVQSLNNAAPKTLIESGVTATTVQDDESEDRAVTIESLVFDQLELLDVNIFE